MKSDGVIRRCIRYKVWKEGRLNISLVLKDTGFEHRTGVICCNSMGPAVHTDNRMLKINPSTERIKWRILGVPLFKRGQPNLSFSPKGLWGLHG
jgi:hypothetical protein